MIYCVAAAIYIVFAICNLSGLANDIVVRNAIQIFLVAIASFAYIHNVCKRECKTAYIIAYFLRLALLLFSVFGREIGNLPFDGGDTEFFYSATITQTSHEYFGHDSLVTITAYISYALGDARLLYQYGLTLLSLLGIRTTELVMEKLEIPKDIVHKCMCILAIMPSFAIFNVIYSREAIVMTCIVASFYFFILHLCASDSLKKFFFVCLAIAFAIVACPFHAAPVSLVMGYVVCLMIYDQKSNCFGITIKSLLFGSSVLFFLISLILLFPNLFEKISGLGGIQAVARRFMYESNLDAGSSYAQYVGDSDTIGRFIVYTPARMFYGMFAPLPWEWRGLADVATFFGDSLLYILAYFGALINIIRKKHWLDFFGWFVLTLLIVAVTIGWGCVAFGTAIRHRDKFLPLFIVLLSLEIKDLKKHI